MAEAVGYIKESEGSETDVVGFIKKFVKTTPKKAKEMREKLRELNLMKLREESIVKIIDFLPETPEELNKVFVDISLDEDEKNKILGIIKEFR